MQSLPSHALNTLVTALVHSRLDYCNVVFAGLPACDIQRLQSVLNAAIVIGRRLIATRSRDFSATRPPLAASETARRVQAVYDGTSLLVRRRTILLFFFTWRTWSCRRLLQLSDLVSDLLHPVQLQCHELHRRSETGPLRRLAHVHGTNFHHRFVASVLLLLSNVNLRHFYIITPLSDIVRRPCCVSALTSL